MLATLHLTKDWQQIILVNGKARNRTYNAEPGILATAGRLGSRNCPSSRMILWKSKLVKLLLRVEKRLHSHRGKSTLRK